MEAALRAAVAASRPSQTPADVRALLEAARQRPGTGSSGMLGSEVGVFSLLLLLGCRAVMLECICSMLERLASRASLCRPLLCACLRLQFSRDEHPCGGPVL